ncbi:sister chromatid cohesion protein PDS5 homolog A isoform X2 [Capsicum annuum]|uniref:sister chromatid cohesion protein PDS5 homolog A isoform X2 n=1 Tax=Capsicum annuum TaxID=4072 RepID=UPI0007BF9A8E|nr:sister chromatid cohesion protein PDS5 homolog A isoform X2 [Capsicum annuum]
MGTKLQFQLKEVGSKLDNPPTTKDSLIKLLKQGSAFLSELEQSPTKAMLEAMQPLQAAIVKPELLKHQDREVKLLVATCICEITRITAPEAPYSDDILKDIFHLVVSTFSGLGDINSPSFGRRVVILETLARYRSCVVMLDLECDDLINEMFRTFLNVVRDEHQDSILTSMQTIMVVLIEESEEIREDLLHVILSVLGRHKKDVSKAGRGLAMKVIEQCSGKLEPSIKEFLVTSISGDSSPTTFEIDYHEVIYDIYRCAPQILLGVVPYITGELLTDQLDVRLKAVHLVGDLFALSESAISEAFQPIFLEFLKRLTDRVVEVRMSVLEHVKGCLLSNPFRQEAPQIISALRDRLLDYDENVRKQVVAVLCDAACNALTSMKVDTIKLVAERIRDKSLLVKRYTLERLADIYRIYRLNSSSGSVEGDDYDWIPGRILRCFYDKDFRSDIVEHILCSSLFPNEFSVKDKVKNWVKVFSSFDKVEVRALEKLLEQKQRLQQEMRRYLSLRQTLQDGDATEIQKKVVFCFRIMSRCFTDPGKAEESFQILDQLKDANVWRILIALIDPDSNSVRASSSRDELLKILGEKHRLYDFLGTLSLKCSYILFNKEHVKEILQEMNIQKSAGSTDLVLSCTHLLVILARFSPFLLSGIEEDLIHLLEDDNEIIKEGVLHVLAKAGGAIREKLGDSSRSLDLMLERICLEGSRRQAKYAIHALASIMKDDGLKSLSVLYKKLVDMLDEKSHLPAVLQSLGCIAQTAMPVFETREKEIEQFIKKNILELSHTSEGKAKESWEDRSEICSMKIYGIKTLVNSYLPVKDANLRMGIDDLLGILKNILSFGEISMQIKSSSVDKAHLRLAAAKAMLRLSKHWDHKIPVDVFYLTLGTSEASFPQVKKLFLNKVHQYLKDRYLDPKYTCAFLLDLQFQQPDFEEIKSNLSDVIQIYQQGKARQLSAQSEAITPIPYPEYILPYLVHALAHHSSFPNIDECKDVKLYEPTYRQLYIFLSMLVHGDEEGKSEGGFSKDKESILTIKSILLSIKHSEDAVDSTKSKNSYAVSDLGLAITNRLVPNQDDLKELKSSVSLPPSLYKQNEKDEEKDQSLVEVKSWLADESVMVHFESIKFETNGTLKSEITEDEAMKDSETEGNEVPLGKIMERLKARSKMRKEVKNDSSPAEGRTENDVDILKVVREIEIDSNNVVDDNKLDARNGHESAVKIKASNKHQKRKTGTNISVPKGAKRQRSSSSVHKISSKFKDSIEKEEDLQSISEDMSSEENVFEPEESDLLTSSIRKKTSLPPKQKRKATDKNYVDTHEIGIDSCKVKKTKGNTEAVNTHAQSNNKSGSNKKQKKTTVAGLAKCTSKDAATPTVDLIGCRIKVWWPMDKKFYEGVVKSFDTQKSKHVVLYDDGDVEVLRLEKECWELVGSVQKPVKGSNSKKVSRYEKISGERKNKSLAASRQKKEMDKMSPLPQVRGKRTPRKNLKYGQRGPSKSSLSRRSLLLGKPLATSKTKVDSLSSESEQKESTYGSVSEHELSDKDEISYSDGKPGVDADRSSGMEDSEEEESPMENKKIEDEPGTPQDSRGSDKTSSSHEIPQADVSTEKSNDDAEISDSHGSVGDDADSHSTDQGDSESSSAAKSDEELSDDEPLSTWKRRVGKSAGGK